MLDMQLDRQLGPVLFSFYLCENLSTLINKITIIVCEMWQNAYRRSHKILFQQVCQESLIIVHQLPATKKTQNKQTDKSKLIQRQ